MKRLLLLFVLIAAPAYAQSIYPDLQGQPLIEALRTEYYPSRVLSYADARDTMYARIDLEPGNQLRGVYTGYTITLSGTADPSTEAFEKGINSEHTWPQSKGATEDTFAHSDIHHLFPAKDNVNSARSNNPYDEIPDTETDGWYWMDQSQSNTPSQNIEEWSEKDNENPNAGFEGRFEPREDHKGDAARAIFYFWTMYSDQADGAFFDVQKEVLRQWHYLDPPDEKEIVRTEAIAHYQGSVNPFVVDTTLVRRAFFEGNQGGGGGGSVETYALYTFEGNDGCPSADPGVDEAPEGLLFSDFFRSFVECNQGQGVFNSSEWTEGSSAVDFVGFSVTPLVGRKIVFTGGNTLTFTVRRSGTGPDQGMVTLRVGSGSNNVLGSWVLDDDSDYHFEVDLPELETTSEIEIRFYGWGATSDRGTLRFDDVRLEMMEPETVDLTPATVALSSPADEDTLTAGVVEFNWQAADRSTTYTLQIAGNSSFTSPLTNERVGATRYSTTLPGDQTFYWRVRGENASAVGPWSTVRTFTTISAPLAVPEALSPENLTTGLGGRITLEWSEVDQADAYNVRATSFSGSVGTLVLDTTGVTGTQIEYVFDYLTTYCWQIQAVNDQGESEWSECSYFSTGRGVGTEREDLPIAFALRENYPNPFNPSTTIPFETSAAGDVRIVVYDVLGREVAVILDQNYPAGRHSVIWDASGLQSGVYLIRMEAGGVLMSRTLIIMK